MKTSISETVGFYIAVLILIASIVFLHKDSCIPILGSLLLAKCIAKDFMEYVNRPHKDDLDVFAHIINMEDWKNQNPEHRFTKHPWYQNDKPNIVDGEYRFTDGKKFD